VKLLINIATGLLLILAFSFGMFLLFAQSACDR